MYLRYRNAVLTVFGVVSSRQRVHNVTLRVWLRGALL